MSDVSAVRVDPPLPCLVCGRTLPPAFGPSDAGRQPCDAVMFVGHGNYGSAVYDPGGTGRVRAWLEVNVCDGCLRDAARAGRVYHTELVPVPDRETVTSWRPPEPDDMMTREHDELPRAGVLSLDEARMQVMAPGVDIPPIQDAKPPLPPWRYPAQWGCCPKCGDHNPQHAPTPVHVFGAASEEVVNHLVNLGLGDHLTRAYLHYLTVRSRYAWPREWLCWQCTLCGGCWETQVYEAQE